MGGKRISAERANSEELLCRNGHIGLWEGQDGGDPQPTRRCMKCARDRARNRHYGLTNDAYEQLRAVDPVCAICGGDGLDCGFGKLEIDHNHDTGEVRGLLCRRCNIFLGHYERKKHLIPSLERYLDARQD